jgi:hypothetical protein
MKKNVFTGLAIVAALFFAMPGGAPVAVAAVPQESGAGGDMVPATPELIRQIQFMLQTLGIDPGPIDGNAQALTNRAAHQFELQNSLPIVDITNNGPIPVAFLEALRKQVAAKLGVVAPPPAPAAPAPAPAAPTPAPAAPAPPPPPAPDRFASCPFEPQDFNVGGKQYTPQAFLDEGFGGSTDRAVLNLQQRLKEAREIAEKIGGAALLEVQRQARVLAYFECRQKIEQAGK